MDRDRQLVPGSWSLVREKTVAAGPRAEECYSKHSGTCLMQKSGTSGKECKSEEGPKGKWGA